MPSARFARRLCYAFLCATMPFLLGIVSPIPAAESVSIDDLAWLSGCWVSVGGEPGSGEQWTTPAGGTMFGVSRIVRNSETVAHEFMQIRQTGEDRIEFSANPSGQVEATFVMVRMSENEAAFENPGHDFPQRIIYLLKADGDLQARIEGQVNGEFRAVDFPLRQVDCVVDRARP